MGQAPNNLFGYEEIKLSIAGKFPSCGGEFIATGFIVEAVRGSAV
jgi:hypothetical protein